MKKTLIALLIALLVLAFSACSAGDKNYEDTGISENFGSFQNGESYEQITELPFMSVENNPTSNISLNCNTASYSIIRNAILDNRSIDTNSVRTEELVNYFSYPSYEEPIADDIKLNYGLMDCPWNSQHKLLTAGLKTKSIDFDNIDNNIVFLIDVSGSMDNSDRLPLVQEAFNLLINNLNDNDTISIVTYASGTKVVIEGTNDKVRLSEAINNLKAGGSTNGSGGIDLAYEMAVKYFKSEGNNRVILATDGDFNVGTSEKEQLKSFIKEKADNNIFLSVLGFGFGNLKDDNLEALANNGNGNYAYIDNLEQAKTTLVAQMNGTLVTVAKDAKAQIEFTDKVDSYRLIGYENKVLTDEEYEDDSTDAGEIGSGLVVTAVYEIILSEDCSYYDTLAFSSVTYKSRNDNFTESENEIISIYLLDLEAMPLGRIEDLNFISAVVEFSLILRNSQYKGTASLGGILTRLNELDLSDDKLKEEFVTLVEDYSRYY